MDSIGWIGQTISALQINAYFLKTDFFTTGRNISWEDGVLPISIYKKIQPWKNIIFNNNTFGKFNLQELAEIH